MSKVHVLKSVQRLPISLEDAWKFFSHPGNLFTLTPPQLNLKFTNKLHLDEMYPGQIITYKVRPLLNIPLFWMTEITHVDKHRFFVDEQRKGPYAMWHHQHHFATIDGGVEMTDIVHYALPFGAVGNLVHGPLVKRELQKIFTFRYHKVIELFGRWTEDAAVNLTIDEKPV